MAEPQKIETTAASTQQGNFIRMQDMTSFKWVMINVLGHDFMHDFLLSANRTKSGSVMDGSKKVSIIKKTEKICKEIGKHLKMKKSLSSELSRGGGHRGGGQFDNPPDLDIEIDDNSKEDIIQLGSELGDGIKFNTDDKSIISSGDQEIGHLEELNKLYKWLLDGGRVTDINISSIIDSGKTKEEVLNDIDEYFADFYTEQVIQDGGKGDNIIYIPKVFKSVSEGIMSGLLSPMIKYCIEESGKTILNNKEPHLDEDGPGIFPPVNSDTTSMKEAASQEPEKEEESTEWNTADRIVQNFLRTFIMIFKDDITVNEGNGEFRMKSIKFLKKMKSNN